MASASVSRSGRVRKKPVKLLDMDTELSGHHLGDNHTRSAPKTSQADHQHIPITDTPIVPPKKNLKFKLSLNPSPVVNSEDESEPKKSTVPVLKIPRSKIRGLKTQQIESPKEEIETQEIDQEIDIDDNDGSNVPTVEVTIPHDFCDEEFEDKPMEELYDDEETKSPIHEIQSEPIVTPLKIDLKSLEKPIEETPVVTKESKPKRKEAESAANKLFRQITSGVANNSAAKAKNNKRKKSSPLEDVTQIASTFEDEFSETSLTIETEDSKLKPKNVRTRPSKPLSINDNKTDTKRNKRTKKDTDDKPKKKRNAVITAYMIWSKEYRSKIQQDCPDLDFADVSRKLGEIWQSMPEKEKIPWRRKAQKLVTKGSSIISTGKPRAVSQKANTVSASSNQAVITSDDYSNTSIEDLWEPIGTTPMDVSAHLTLLGESLSTIGQRLKEHNGQIAVSGSLSVLLDSTLCAIGPLLCLTQLHPSLDGCFEETHKKTLDNIAYIMPGI